MPKKLQKRINWFVSAVLFLSFFARVYRLPELLGFWYDQGRDALVIWDLIHNGKLFLIGPMMGDTGIFRGPWYYYLLTPFYYLGDGNPLWPAYFLIITTVIAIFFVYKIGGLIPLLLSSFSVYLIGSSRWLSNPTPMFLISVLLLLSTFSLFAKKRWALPMAAFLIGMGLNFGAATEIFYIPALIIVLALNKKIIPSAKIILLSFITFAVAFIPQVIFEFRHQGVLTNALKNFLINEKSFTLNFFEIAKSRLLFDYEMVASKFWLDGSLLFLPFFVVLVLFLVGNFKKFWTDNLFKTLIIFSLTPLAGTLFFVSNKGGVYEYYFTGYYLIFILFFSYLLTKMWQGTWGRIFVSIFMLIFLVKNTNSYLKTYNISLNNPEIIAFENQLKAIEWIYDDSGKLHFNVDVYVPPVVPYAYDYLFNWQEYKKDDFRLDRENRIELLYTLYEADPPHPERLFAWQSRQNGIGEVEKSIDFGGVTVERRKRI